MLVPNAINECAWKTRINKTGKNIPDISFFEQRRE
jgi:hypothetical protein